MAFTIVHPESHQTSWVPIFAGDNVFQGAIVSQDIDDPEEGVTPIAQATGAHNTTAKDRPMGVVLGFNTTANDRLWDSTQKAEYATGVAVGSSWHSTTQYRGVEGPWSRGDKLAMALIHHIDATTVIRGDIYNGAVGTGSTLLTFTTGCAGDGIGGITNACQEAPETDLATLYMRTGENAGIYRTLTSSSTTTHTWLQGMPNTIAIGDTGVIVGLRPYGYCRCQFDAEATYIDSNADVASNYFGIHVRRLDLSKANGEYVEFTFDGDHFASKRT